jgi:prepilin-type N-terminal cleavage/methylation domain-containing protein
MPRSGFTLMEMVLVVMIIAIAAGIAVPVVESLLHPNQVAASIDTVRTNWEQTRARAMEEGRPYRFSIAEGGNTFRIEPDDADTNLDAGYTIEGELPESCLFVDGGTGIIDASAKAVASGGWKSVVVFLPDGTAREDVELSFGRPGLARVTLRLRALTGSVSQVMQTKDVTR